MRASWKMGFTSEAERITDSEVSAQLGLPT